MKRTLLVAPVLALMLCIPGRAEAKLFEIWGQGLVGGVYGNGKTDRDFYSWARGGAAGVEVGASILFFSAYIDYLRFFGGDTGANLISFNLGGDYSLGITKSFKIVFRVAGTFYYGTLDDVAQDSGTGSVAEENAATRGIGARGGVGVRYVFWKIFSIGITPLIGYHYFFGDSDDDPTQTDLNSSGWDFQALAYFRVGLGF